MTRQLLIADDDVELVEMLTQRCRRLGWEIDSATNSFVALDKIEKNPPDMAILDLDMPPGNGLSVCEMMATHPRLRHIPVIIMTGSTSHDTVRRCHHLSAFYVQKCSDLWPRIEPVLRDLFPNDPAEPAGPREYVVAAGDPRPRDVMDAVFAVLGHETGASILDETESETTRRTDQPWVLSIEDDDDMALALQLRLREFGAQVVRASAGTEGYRRAFLDSPRAIILDYELPRGNGDYVLRRLKESPATRDLPVIVLTGRRDASIERQMRNLGAAEFLTKPMDWSLLRAALSLHLGEPCLKASC